MGHLRSLHGEMIGRGAEVEMLSQRLLRAKDREGSASFVFGEPGIGKTRLVGELAARAREAGFHVITGHCYEDEQAIPYRPVIEALKQTLRSASSADGELLLARLHNTADPAADGMELLDAFADYFLNWSGQHPGLLIVEDLHWADATSIRALRHLARRVRSSRLVLLGTYRPADLPRQHALAGFLLEVFEKRLGDSVELHGLTIEETASLAAQHLGFASLTVAEARTVSAESGGNPFYIEELCRHWSETVGAHSAQDIPPRDWQVPPGLSGVIGARLARLSPDVTELLATAAVMGRTFDLELLGEVAAVPPEEARAAMDHAVAAHMVRRLASRRGDFEFVHALVQRCLVDSLAESRRQQAHLAVARALEARPRGAESTAAVIAHQYFCAGQLVPDALLLDYGERAFKAAVDVYAADEAREWLESTLSAMRERSVCDDDIADFLDRTLSDAFNLAALSQQRICELSEFALGRAAERQDTEAQVRLRVVLAFAYGMQDDLQLHRPTLALAHLEEVLRIAEDPLTRVRCRVHLAANLMVLGRYHEAREVSREFETSEWPAARASALIFTASANAYDGIVTDSLHNYRKAWHASVAMTGTAPAATLAGTLAVSWDIWTEFLLLRSPAGALELLLSERTRGRQPLPTVATWDIWEAAMQREMGLPEGTPLRRLRFEEMTAVSYHFAIRLLFLRGHWDEGICRGDEILHRAGDDHVDFRATLALCRPELFRYCGRFGEAAEATEDLFVQHARALDVTGHTALALIAAEKGDTEALVVHAADARRRMTDDDWLGLGARVDLVSALASVASGDSAASEAHFEQATRRMRELQIPWDEADAHFVYARLLQQMGDAQAALPHLDAALSILARIEAPAPFVERVSAALPPAARQPAGANGLSSREIEVLHLLAEGCSNRQIAERLVISEPTVATHVRHILEKTGTANRTAAASWASRNLQPLANHQN